jgi:RHS repeat-associated protein
MNHLVSGHTEVPGKAFRSGSAFNYEYWVKDHLGNTRVTFYQNPVNSLLEVLQQNDYYPFGLSKVRGTVTGNKTAYLYNGKEDQEGFSLYDYGARYYDPIIARWHVPDPLAEQFASTSPYKYAGNNPINMIDPDGRAEAYGVDIGNTGGVDHVFSTASFEFNGEKYGSTLCSRQEPNVIKKS